MPKKWLRILGWIVIVITSLFFIQNGIQKLIGAEQMVIMFRELGFPDWFRMVVGLVETAGGIALLIPRAIRTASIVMGILMVGAVLSELRYGHVFQAMIAGQWLVIFILIIVFQFRSYWTERNKKSQALNDQDHN